MITIVEKITQQSGQYHIMTTLHGVTNLSLLLYLSVSQIVFYLYFPLQVSCSL